METQKRLTKEEVDRELEKLKERHANRNEDTDLYHLKKENLYTLRRLVIRGEQEWERIQEISPSQD